MSRELVRSDSVDRYLKEVGRYPLLSREDEYRLARTYKDAGDVGAAHALVVSNLRFVVSVAKHYRRSGLSLMELIQEGNIGLMQAVKRFDPDRGYRLITYAVWWIRARIRDFVLRMWSVVRVGSGRVRRRLFFKLRGEQARAQQEGVETAELARRLDASESEVVEMDARLAAPDCSLDLPTSTGAAFRDFLADMATPLPDESASAREHLSELRATLGELEDKLDARDKMLLERRLLSEDPCSLAEIGKTLGVSRQRVKQLEARLVAKIGDALGATPR